MTTMATTMIMRRIACRTNSGSAIASGLKSRVSYHHQQHQLQYLRCQQPWRSITTTTTTSVSLRSSPLAPSWGTSVRSLQSSSSSSSSDDAAASSPSDQDASSSSTDSSSSSNSSTPAPKNIQYMTRDGIPLKLPDPAMETKFLEQQHAVRQEYQKASYSKALDLSQQLYTQMMGHYGTMYHPAVASTLNNIGLMHKSLGEWDDARTHYQKSMSIYEKVVGKDHASYAATLHNVALLNKLQVQVEQTQGVDGHDENDDENQDEDETKDPKPLDPKTIKRHSDLLDEAVDYLEKAWKIRQGELGEEHPKTVESRSSLGSTLAYKILWQHGNEHSSTSIRMATSAADGEESKKKRNSRVKKLRLPLWEVAEEHLREALKSAMANAARAEPQATPSSSPASSALSPPASEGPPKMVVTTTSSAGTSTTSSSSTSKKAESSTTSSSSSSNSPSTESRITTLAAATAAQNLAVCLKYRATNAAAVTSPLNPKKRQLLLHQARDLYQQALATRLALLKDEFHPHVIMSKHSLAECLDAMGDKLEANQLRMEMLDSYDRHVLKRKQEKEAAEKNSSTKKK